MKWPSKNKQKKINHSTQWCVSIFLVDKNVIDVVVNRRSISELTECTISSSFNLLVVVVVFFVSLANVVVGINYTIHFRAHFFFSSSIEQSRRRWQWTKKQKVSIRRINFCCAEHEISHLIIFIIFGNLCRRRHFETFFFFLMQIWTCQSLIFLMDAHGRAYNNRWDQKCTENTFNATTTFFDIKFFNLNLIRLFCVQFFPFVASRIFFFFIIFQLSVSSAVWPVSQSLSFSCHKIIYQTKPLH